MTVTELAATAETPLKIARAGGIDWEENVHLVIPGTETGLVQAVHGPKSTLVGTVEETVAAQVAETVAAAAAGEWAEPDMAEAVSTMFYDRPQQITVMRDDSLCTFEVEDAMYSRMMDINPKHLFAVRYPFVIKSFTAGSIGRKYGLLEGDSLVSIGGQPTPTAVEFMTTLPLFADDTVTIGFYRQGEYHAQKVELNNDGRLGIYAMNPTDIFEVKHTSYTVGEAIPAGISYGWEKMVEYVSSLRILFTKDGAKNLGGFLAMGSLFPKVWDWYAFWNLTALLALVLAFMNIIPIPGLDGGHIVITLYEMITRRKASEKALDVIQKIGMALLLLLLIVANGNDLIRLFNGWF